MFGLAAHRTEERNLVVISPKDGVEFEVNEDILNINMIELGDFCRIQVADNRPVAFSREKNGLKGVKVVVEKDDVLVSGVKGKLTKGLALFYKTEQFGDVACKDEDAKDVGKEFEIVVSRLAESERTGMYSKCVWKGVKNANPNPTIKSLSKKLENIKVETEESDTDEDDEDDDEDQSRKVIGVVTGINPYKNRAYVACSLTYPGIDGLVQCYCHNKRKVGDWVEVRFSKKDFEKYFPSNPKESTPRFFTNRHKKIENPGNYSINLVNKSPEIEIKALKLPLKHKTGDNIVDKHLGVISDRKRLMPNGPTAVNVVIARQKVIEAKGGKLTTWYVKEVNGKNSEESSSSESEKAKLKIKKKKEETPDFLTGPPVFAPHGFLPPMFFPPMFAQMMNGPPSAGASTSQIRGFGFQTEKELESKRAVVTSVKPNKSTQNSKDTMVFLWLLDDHIQSIFYVSSKDKLYPGHFFEGKFSQNGSKWVCQKYVRALGKLADGSVSNDSIELQVTVDALKPATDGRAYPETRHEFTGKIVDKFHKLPQNLIDGVKIGIRLWNFEEKNQWGWVVSSVFQPRNIRLLSAFHKAWNSVGIRDLVREKCPRQFRNLRELMDDEVEKVESPKNTDESYAWTTVQDGDFVRMMVFPRQEGQKFSQMKQNVTDSNVYKDVQKMEVHKLYKVELDAKGKVTKMTDCAQVFSANENGEIKLVFATNNKHQVGSNIALVEPVGVPKWIGKLIFPMPDNQSMPGKRMLWRSTFRLLNESDPLADNHLVSEHGVCFASRGGYERVQDDSPITQSPFDARLEALSSEMTVTLSKEVGRLVHNSAIVAALKRQHIDTERLIKLSETR